MHKSTDLLQQRSQALTKSAFLWTQVLRAPFWAIFNLLLFILYKDLHASPFQITLFIILKPAVSLLSMYWGARIHKRPDRLVSNILAAGIIGYLPFLLFPFFYNAWFVLFAAAVFMVMHRGVVPAWMEIFKLNLPKGVKEKVFSLGSTVSYVVGAILPVVIGPLLDHYPLAWRCIFSIAALVGISALFLQRRIPIAHSPILSPHTLAIREHISQPWKNAFHLLRTRLDFRSFQIGFMALGGCGLMLMQPALPKFFVDVLRLSYTELSIALLVCKGAGFILTAPMWARGMPKFDIFNFSSFVTTAGALFSLILLLGKFHVTFIYLAYFTYGIMQAGSELIWHLAGPHFSKDSDSSSYSNLSVLAVGVRGLIIPFLGSLLILFIPSAALLVIGALLSFSGTLWMRLYKKPYPDKASPIKTGPSQPE